MPPDDTQEPRITVTENGPYLVEGKVIVRNALGEDVTVGAEAWLCRCGHSTGKPFCTDMHSKVGFVGTEVASRDLMADRRDEYPGEEITILDDRSRCSHAGHCTDGLPVVWKLNEEPWIDALAGSADQIIATIRQCPSGALTYALPGSDETVEEAMEPSITASPNGPYRVRGGIQVFSESGEPYEKRNRQTLCRCGQSKNKPFCDGSHWYADFKDPA